MFEARSRLGKFGITGDEALSPLGSLSGGQRVRVSLTAITWDSPHVLLLDEPTNHLDEASTDALASAVRAFQGAVVAVSHNRSFLAACCSDLWVAEEGQVLVFRSDSHADFPALFQDYTATIAQSPSVTQALADVGGGASDVLASALARQASARAARGGANSFEALMARAAGDPSPSCDR